MISFLKWSQLFFNHWYVSSPGYNFKIHSWSLWSQFKIHYQTEFGKYIKNLLWFHFTGDPSSFSIFHMFLALVIILGDPRSSLVIISGDPSHLAHPSPLRPIPSLLHGELLKDSSGLFTIRYLIFRYYFEDKELLMFLLRCWWLYPCVLPLLSWTCIIGSPAHTRCQLGWDEDIDKDKPLPYQHHQNQYRNHHHHNHHGTQVRAVLIQKMPGILLMRVPKQVHQNISILNSSIQHKIVFVLLLTKARDWTKSYLLVTFWQISTIKSTGYESKQW